MHCDRLVLGFPTSHRACKSVQWSRSSPPAKITFFFRYIRMLYMYTRPTRIGSNSESSAQKKVRWVPVVVDGSSGTPNQRSFHARSICAGPETVAPNRKPCDVINGISGGLDGTPFRRPCLRNQCMKTVGSSCTALGSFRAFRRATGHARRCTSRRTIRRRTWRFFELVSSLFFPLSASQSKKVLPASFVSIQLAA